MGPSEGGHAASSSHFCHLPVLPSAVDGELTSPATGGPVGADDFVDQRGRRAASQPGPGNLRAGVQHAPHGSRLVTTRRTYVLDTSVLLSDPGALLRFGDSDVVLPLVVIGELEDKRHHPELGWFARQALRILDDLRVAHGRLDAPVPVGDGEDAGTLHV